ncbi:MAG TPA: hypothetical protein VHX42_03295 [Candidatus Babeliales bacterium]|nr:hypothetical protein [Candidatus Babeliales bacterium]
MNRLHSFLFLSLSLAIFSCSAMEQLFAQHTNNNDTESIIQQRTHSLERQSLQSWTNFINDAKTLQQHLTYTNDYPPFINNELRLTMAESLNPLKKQIIFQDRLLTYMYNRPYTSVHKLKYINETQKKLRDINDYKFTSEDIDRQIIVIGEITHATRPIGYNKNTYPLEEQQIYDEIQEMKEKNQQLDSILIQSASEQKNEIVNRLRDFLIITQKKETKELQKIEEKQRIKTQLKEQQEKNEQLEKQIKEMLKTEEQKRKVLATIPQELQNMELETGRSHLKP